MEKIKQEKIKATQKELRLQKKIIEAIENKKDTSALVKQLADLRAKIAEEAELKELKKVADQRAELKDKAAKVIEKAAKQNKAILEFLKKRDILLDQLKPLIEPMKELAKLQAASWERLPGKCYLFNDIGQFNAAIKGIPQDYFPEGFGVDFLQMKGGQINAIGKAKEAQQYFLAAYGLIAAFEKVKSRLPLQAAEGLMSLDKKSEKKK